MIGLRVLFPAGHFLEAGRREKEADADMAGVALLDDGDYEVVHCDGERRVWGRRCGWTMRPSQLGPGLRTKLRGRRRCTSSDHRCQCCKEEYRDVVASVDGAGSMRQRRR